MFRIFAIIPARDEAATVAETVETVCGIPGVEHVLVIDDGSRDDTARLATAAGARVIAHSRSRGKGSALEAGLVALDGAKAMGWEPPDAVLFLDADLGQAAAEASLLLGPILTGDAEMTIAAFPRPPRGAGGFGLVKGLARRGIRSLGSRTYDATSPLSGQRALSKRAMRAVRPIASGYGVEVALTIKALQAGLRVLEVPTTMTHRHTGRDVSGFLHRGRQFVDIAVTLATLALDGRGPAETPRT